MLTDKNRVKVCDLGEAMIIKDPNLRSRDKVGTPLYLAPEIVSRNVYGCKVDVWALGCVLYNLANYELPFFGDNMITLRHNIV